MKSILKIVIFLEIVFLIIFGPKYLKNEKISKLLNDNYQPKYVINDLYRSKEVYYRLLNDKEKNIYDLFINKMINYETNFSFSLSDYGLKPEARYPLKMISSVIGDHPELIHFGVHGFSSVDNDKYNVTISYVVGPTEYNYYIDKFSKQIQEVQKATENLSNYEKVKYVYEYLGTRNIYSSTRGGIDQSAISALDDSLSPVCAGYARASQILLTNVGVDTLLGFGQLKENIFFGGNHEWNIVRIDGKFYNYDVTQSSIHKEKVTDDISYVGLLPKNKKQFEALDNSVYPFIYNAKYNYFSYNKLSYKYNNETVKILKQKINNTNKSFIEVEIQNLNAQNFSSLGQDFQNYTIGKYDKVLFILK